MPCYRGSVWRLALAAALAVEALAPAPRSGPDISLPDRRTVRLAIGPCVSRWARAHGYPPHAVHQTIHRYAGRTVDPARVWGERTHAVLRALAAAVREAA